MVEAGLITKNMTSYYYQKVLLLTHLVVVVESPGVYEARVGASGEGVVPTSPHLVEHNQPTASVANLHQRRQQQHV